MWKNYLARLVNFKNKIINTILDTLYVFEIDTIQKTRKWYTLKEFALSFGKNLQTMRLFWYNTCKKSTFKKIFEWLVEDLKGRTPLRGFRIARPYFTYELTKSTVVVFEAT